MSQASLLRRGVAGDGQPPAECWPALLERIRAAGKACQVSVSAAGALRVVRELGGQGLLLLINESLTPAEGKRLLRELACTRQHLRA